MRGILVPDWPAPQGVRAAVATRAMEGHSHAPFGRMNLGTRCGDDPAAVAANRAMLVDALPLPSAPLWLQQVHGNVVVDADVAQRADEPVADAAVSRGTAVLAVLTADCLPVLFASHDARAIGVAHAGWRGLAAGVLEATLGALRVEPARVIAWIGPAIGAASYEVGEEVRAA
ncbi:MAG TPA: laccase domain-containing protein, partial [Dokdonella sp.]